MRRQRHIHWFLLVVLAIAAGCSKKAPKDMRAVPADADIVATINAPALLAYSRTALPKLLPPDMQAQAPMMISLLNQQAQAATGIDIDSLKKITFIGYAGSEDKMAILAEGLTAESIKGEKIGEHNGITHYANSIIHYAALPEIGLVAAPSEMMLKKILDTHAGKTECIADNDRGKILANLIKADSDLDQLRFYLLTGEIPDVGKAPFAVRGGSMFFHLDKGIAGQLLTDEAGAQQLKSQLDMGKLGVQMALAAGGSSDLGLGVELDDNAKKTLGQIINKLTTSSTKESVTVAYRGDLKPIIEKVLSYALKDSLPGLLGTPPASAAIPEPPKAPPAP